MNQIQSGECLPGVAEGRLEGSAGCEAEDGMSSCSVVRDVLVLHAGR